MNDPLLDIIAWLYNLLANGAMGVLALPLGTLIIIAGGVITVWVRVFPTPPAALIPTVRVLHGKDSPQ
jgi:hypothetical protein